MSLLKIKSTIRDVIDFPEQGIVFKDITPVLRDAKLFKETIELMSKPYKTSPPDLIVGIDARGFIFGSAIAYNLGCGFALVRKKGKLPWHCHEETYELEYGSATLEIHKDAIKVGDNILLVDDLLATGGTVNAAVKLLKRVGAGSITGAFFIELAFLKGRQKLDDLTINSLITID